jgi:hypothetical protein
MKKDEFTIGLRFFMGAREYQCTDVGTRVAVAVEITEWARLDPTWLNGPTYAIPEIVIDEDDFPACSLVDNRFEDE